MISIINLKVDCIVNTNISSSFDEWALKKCKQIKLVCHFANNANKCLRGFVWMKKEHSENVFPFSCHIDN